MKKLLGLLVLIFLGFYAWGWYIHVHGGLMGTPEYTSRFMGLTGQKIGEAVDGAKRLLAAAKTPPERREFGTGISE